MKSVIEQRTRRSRTRAFTLVELLVSLAIIFILVTLAFYSLKTVRRSSSRTESLNALRQMTGGYSSYSSENKGGLMPGYIDPADFNDPSHPFYNMSVRMVDTGYELAPEDKASYVWRLAPYLDNAWKTYLVDYHSSDIEARFAMEYGDGADNGVFGPASADPNASPPDIGLAMRPSFGLNSIYLGGDPVHGFACACGVPPAWCYSSGQPLPPRVPALRMSEVKNPSKLIVFGATRAFNSPELKTARNVNVELGYPVLKAPFIGFNPETQVVGDNAWLFVAASTKISQIELTAPGAVDITGVPYDRLGDGKVPVSRLDGSVDTELLQGLGPNDVNPQYRPKMTRWSPFALGD